MLSSLSCHNRCADSKHAKECTDAILVYVAARRVANARTKTAGHPNVILLDNVALERFYGPTIAGAPQFSLRAARTEQSAGVAPSVGTDESKCDAAE